MTENSVDRRYAPARMMLIRAFFAQNVAIGCIFGGLTVAILALEQRYHSSRTTADMVLAVAMLSMSLFSPAVGGVIARWGLRKTMIAGVILSALGYVALACAPTMGLVLLFTGVLIGPGAALFGVIPASMLASGWFPGARGRALGITHTPAFAAFLPPIGLPLIEYTGLTTFLLLLAGLHLLLLVLTLGVKDPPTSLENGSVFDDAEASVVHSWQTIVSRAMFWPLALGYGILSAVNISIAVHVIPLTMEEGVSASATSLLLAFAGGASLGGAIISGFLSDRIGAGRTLALAGVGTATSWAILAATTWYPALAVSMILTGICSAAVFPPINVMAAQLFGFEALPRVLGLLTLFALPLTVSLPPLIGAAREMIGNYTLISASIALTCIMVAILFAMLAKAAHLNQSGLGFARADGLTLNGEKPESLLA